MDIVSWKNKESTALQLLESWVIKTPNRRFLVFEPGVSATFKEMWDLSGKIYAYLKSRGIKAEDVVMYCLPRGIELLACMIGTMRAGAAFVLTETGNDKRTEFIRKDCRCKLYVDESDWNDIIQTEPLEGYEQIRLHSLCYIAYTSGTTSNPKGVLHEYGSLDNAWKSALLDGVPLFNEEDTFILAVSMNFVALPLFFALSCAFGYAMAIMPYEYKSSREKFYSYVEKVGVNCGYITPSFLRTLLPFQHPWRVCILTSEPADGLFLENTLCYNCYASTESGCLLTIFRLPCKMNPAPVGKSQSDVSVFILGEDDMGVPEGTLGEVCYRNPYVRGYINLPEKTQGLIRGGVFHSGDRGKIDSNGNLILHGRIDEMFKIGGYRIEPDEIANVVSQVSGLSHIVVRGFVYKDLSAIIVFYTDDIEIDNVSMREQLLNKLPEYMIPTNYIHLDSFPLLENGKLNKLQLLPPEGSWEALRTISDSNFPVIERGQDFCVYGLGNDKTVKIFRHSIPFVKIWHEMIQMQEAYASGLSVQNAYELVRFGSDYGIMMDRKERKL